MAEQQRWPGGPPQPGEFPRPGEFPPPGEPGAPGGPGVPGVPGRPPGDPGQVPGTRVWMDPHADWQDRLYDRLLEKRIIMATGMLDDDAATRLSAQFLTLDAEGDEALTRAILGLRARGAITVVVAHRPSAIAGVDYILIMAKGRQQQFGPKEEILTRITAPNSAPRALKVADQGGAG